MKWNYFYSKIMVLSLIHSAPIFAINSDNNTVHYTTGNWFLSLGAGVQSPQWHDLMKVNNDSGFAAPYNKDLYSTKNQSKAVIALSLGRRWQRDYFWFPSYSFGVFWQYFFRTHIGNTSTVFSDRQFTNYKYKLDLTANLLLASAKLNLVHYGKFSPYINGGIGSSFNRTSDYTEKVLTEIEPRMSPRFAKFSTSEFAYHIGAGLDFQCTTKLLISLGYIYQDLGQISTGSGKDIWANQSLSPGSYHSNELLVSVSYLFEK